MRIAFFGTPHFAVVSLRRIYVHDRHPIVGVVTAPDKPAGRGQKLSIPPVKACALELGLSILQPLKLSDLDFLAKLRSWGAECFVVVAYRILPEPVFTMPSRGTINLHASLLPSYRGAAPIRWALFDGQKQTGVTTFLIQREVDTGDVLRSQAIAVGPEETHGELEKRLAEIGADVLVETLDLWERRAIEPKMQNVTIVTKAPKITTEDRPVDWSWPADMIFNRIRGLSPDPGAVAHFRQRQIKILQSQRVELPAASDSAVSGMTLQADPHHGVIVATGDGALRLTKVQPAGKRPITGAEFVRGYRVQPDERWM